MGDNLPPNVGAEEISEKKKDCCLGLASRPVMACDVQDSERHDSVQKEIIKKENQKDLYGPSFAAKSAFEEQKLVPAEDFVTSDNSSVELFVQKELIKEGKQKNLAGPFVAKSGFEEQKLVPTKDHVPSDNSSVELMKDKQIIDELGNHLKQLMDFYNSNMELIHNEHSKKQQQRSHHHSSQPIPDFTSPPFDFSEYMALANSFSSHSSFIGQNPNSDPNSN